MPRPAANALAFFVGLSLLGHPAEPTPLETSEDVTAAQSTHLIQEPVSPGPVTLTHRGQRYTGYLVDTRGSELSLRRQGESGELLAQLDAARAQTEAQGKRFLFATNSGIFEPGFPPLWSSPA